VVWERFESSEHRDEHDEDKERDGDEREESELELGSSEHSDSLDEAFSCCCFEFVELL
jgi:hypothetical protein